MIYASVVGMEPVKIYALVDTDDTVLYVGKTNQTLQSRASGHKMSSNTCGSKDIPQGCEWTITLVDTASEDDVLTKEQEYITVLNPKYNVERKTPYDPSKSSSFHRLISIQRRLSLVR